MPVLQLIPAESRYLRGTRVRISAAFGGAAGDKPLFASFTGGHLAPSNVINRLGEAMDAVKYGWVTSHVFRKTVGTVLDEADLPTTAIADQPGNSREVAEKHYRKRRVANRANAAALEGMLPSPEA